MLSAESVLKLNTSFITQALAAAIEHGFIMGHSAAANVCAMLKDTSFIVKSEGRKHRVVITVLDFS